MPRSPLFIGAEAERDRATRLGVGRMTVGSTLIATGVARRLFGVPAEYDNGAARLVARLAGVRNIALGAWSLQVRDHSKAERRLCYQLNAAVDAADVAVLLWAGITHKELRRAALMGSALGVSMLLGWMDLLEDA
jgi:hypothetical protein